ncbi:type II toxin-antitoxin system RelE family toxin [Rubrobacter aplysinae]|uniref:type II toxin-antitoxin system RelE family toxin n=1 Tax=Rubrobacter aplysinae TaxID=909625 RepID=UPI00064C02FB|nr:type II toxin-antitoxin system RelE/ParE family toxin [Rubrobacter aplysinae]
MSYRLEVVRRAQKQLARIQVQDRERIMDGIDAIADDPKSPGSTKLQGYTDTWYVRVGDYRIIYELDEVAGEIIVIRVAHRREACR